MLLEFSVNNFRSIKESVTFSLAATTQDQGNTFPVRDNFELLKCATLYGANASGKSNVLKAFIFMKRMVLNQFKIIQSHELLPNQPFKLSTETDNASSTFQVVFFMDGYKYRYGFEMDQNQVYSEWLYQDEKGKEARLFYREMGSKEPLGINSRKFKEGRGLKVPNNQLILWKSDQGGGEISAKIMNWFKNVNLIDCSDEDQFIEYSRQKLMEESFRKEIKEFLTFADLGIVDLMAEETNIPEDFMDKLPFTIQFKNPDQNKIPLFKKISINTSHQKFDEKTKEMVGLVQLDLMEESLGTKKFLVLMAPIFDALKNGKILLIDELNASLHPMLTRELVRFFHNKEMNKKNAQLIFTTHDTSLLSLKIFRRDQVWFTEKDQYGATDLYSLADHKNVRKEENYEKNYLQGKYGGVPFIGELSFGVEK